MTPRLVSPAPARRVRLTPLPEGSNIIERLPGADFADCYQFADQWPDRNAFETFLELFSRTPGWMNFLMSIRNQTVRWVGLKHLGVMAVNGAAKPAASYCAGARVGIFTLERLHADEVIVGDDDKHLHVQVSLRKHLANGQPVISLSTVVHIHNALGHLYMAVVGPAHRLIVPVMLRQIVRG